MIGPRMLSPESARRGAALAGLALALAALPRIGAWASAPPELTPTSPDRLARAACGRDPAEALLLGRPIPIDAATPEALALLPGIGPSTARALAEARPGTLAEAGAIAGIGAARMRTLARYVTDPSPTPAPPCR